MRSRKRASGLVGMMQAEYRLDREPDAALAALPRFSPQKVRADFPSTAVYQDIAHWFVYAGSAFLIGGIGVRRI